MNRLKPSNPALEADPPSATIPVPTGTRDLLPEETAELREISSAMLKTLTDRNYGEVSTPAFEYEETMRLAGGEALDRAYRIPDKDGKMLVTRFDSTVPIARLAATRYHDAQLPLRFCYLQSVFRPVEPKRGQSREFVQLGMELLGLAAPDGDAEAIELLVRTLESAGLSDFHIVVGDARFFIDQLDGVDGSSTRRDEAATAILHELQTRDFVGLRRELAASDQISAEAAKGLTAVAAARGGREVLERFGADRLLELDDQLAAAGIGERVIYDLGLIRSLSYYTGSVLEVYVPSDGFSIAGGGRYDDLAGRFGRELEAFGFAINIDRLHLALIAERDGGRGSQ